MKSITPLVLVLVSLLIVPTLSAGPGRSGSLAFVQYLDAVVLEVSTDDGEIVKIAVEAQGALEVFHCVEKGVLGRTCADLEPGDVADFKGRPLPQDSDRQGVQLLELCLHPLVEIPGGGGDDDDPGSCEDCDGR